MIEIDKFEFDGKEFQGIKSTIPGGPPLILIKGEKGFVMCGYLSGDVAERFGLAAAIVSGVSNFNDVLNAEIKVATSKAKELGVESGMIVKKVIGKLG
ncbi:YunC family protein [Thermoproteota archaeon]